VLLLLLLLWLIYSERHKKRLSHIKSELATAHFYSRFFLLLSLLSLLLLSFFYFFLQLFIFFCPFPSPFLSIFPPLSSQIS